MTTNHLKIFKEVSYLIEKPELWCFVEECHKKSFGLEDLPSLFEDIRSTDLQKQHLGVIGIRKILENPNKLQIQQVINANLVPRLIEILELDDFHYLKYEVGWILTNLSTGNTLQVLNIVENGGIISLMKLLDSKYPPSVEQSFLNNIKS